MHVRHFELDGRCKHREVECSFCEVELAPDRTQAKIVGCQRQVCPTTLSSATSVADSPQVLSASLNTRMVAKMYTVACFDTLRKDSRNPRLFSVRSYDVVSNFETTDRAPPRRGHYSRVDGMFLAQPHFVRKKPSAPLRHPLHAEFLKRVESETTCAELRVDAVCVAGRRFEIAHPLGLGALHGGRERRVNLEGEARGLKSAE